MNNLRIPKVGDFYQWDASLRVEVIEVEYGKHGIWVQMVDVDKQKKMGNWCSLEEFNRRVYGENQMKDGGYSKGLLEGWEIGYNAAWEDIDYNPDVKRIPDHLLEYEEQKNGLGGNSFGSRCYQEGYTKGKEDQVINYVPISKKLIEVSNSD